MMEHRAAVAEIDVSAFADNPAAAKQFNAVDLARGFVAVLIIAVHTRVFMQIDETWDFVCTQIIGKIGVPYFFVTASYFFFRKINLSRLRHQPTGDEIKRLKYYISRLVKIYLIWSTIYLIPLFHECLTNDYSFRWTAFATVKGFAFGGIHYHLWYMTTLIVLILTVYMMFRHIKPRYVLVLAVVCAVFGLSMATYSVFIHSNLWSRLIDADRFFHTISRVPLECIFVVLGALLSQRRALPLNRTAALALFLLSLAAMTAEAFFLKSAGCDDRWGAYITMPFVAVFLFLFLANVTIKDNRFIPHFRRVGLLMYLVHPLFIFLYKQMGGTNHVYMFFAVTFCSIVFTAAIIGLSQRVKRLHFLSYLY
ncbi:MAG: acyltransferase [Phycisphaerae bacterium]|nr:acyltransferase [Phycisphaerae bacterium]